MDLLTFSFKAAKLSCAGGILLIAGCGGSGNSGGGTPTPPPTAALHYIFDPAVTPIQTENFANVFATGVSSKGAWMGIALHDSSSTPGGGYFINGVYTPFPISKVTAEFIETEGAGGTFVWATYQLTSQAYGTAILNLTTNKIITVPNTFLANEAVVSPDGTSALVSIYDSTGNDTGTYAFLTSAGKETVLPYKQIGFMPDAHSNTGWTVGGGGLGSNAVAEAKLRKSAQPSRGIARPLDGSHFLLISPKGTAIGLAGVNPGANAVNDTGISAGIENDTDGTSIAAMWDSTGKETILKKLVAGNNEQAYAITDNGLIAGESVAPDGTSTAVIWQPDGTVVNLGARVTVTGQQSFGSARMVQENGKIYGLGTDASGNPILAGIIPSK